MLYVYKENTEMPSFNVLDKSILVFMTFIGIVANKCTRIHLSRRERFSFIIMIEFDVINGYYITYSIT